MKARRVIAVVLALSLVSAGAATMPVSAVDGVTIRASTVTSAAGEVFSVDVSLEAVPETGINTMDFAVTYDGAALTVTDVTLGAAATTDTSGDTTAADAPVFAYNITGSAVNISWTTGLPSDAWIHDDGVILTVSGTVAEDAEDGTYPIAFAPIDRETYQGSGATNDTMVIGYIYNDESAAYEISDEAGAVVVGEAATTTTTTGTDTGETTTTTTTTTTEAVTDDSGSGTTSGEGTLELAYGDMDEDGSVTLADCVLLSQYISQIATISPAVLTFADLDQNGVLGDKNDAVILLRYLAGAYESIPITE